MPEKIPEHVRDFSDLLLWLADKHHAGDLHAMARLTGIPVEELRAMIVDVAG